MVWFLWQEEEKFSKNNCSSEKKRLVELHPQTTEISEKALKIHSKNHFGINAPT